VVEEVVREGFLWALPPLTAEWVTCHRPASLEGAITLAEDHPALPPRAWGKSGGGPSPHFRRGPVPCRPPEGSRANPPGRAASPAPSQPYLPQITLLGITDRTQSRPQSQGPHKQHLICQDRSVGDAAGSTTGNVSAQ